MTYALYQGLTYVKVQGLTLTYALYQGLTYVIISVQGLTLYYKMPLFKKPYDLIAIGDIVIDAFVRLKDAHVTCKLNNEDCEICMKFGDKIPFEFDRVIAGVGNSPNAAVAAARLGLRSALIASVGRDERGQECLAALSTNKVSTDYISTQAGKKTNFHYVLWYGPERTILVKHEDFAYSLPKELHSLTPKWIYLSSMGVASEKFHDEIADYLEKNPSVKLAFQPGTFQMELGKERLERIYARTEVFCVNVEEAQRILGVPDSDRHIKSLCQRLANLGPKIVLLTDGPEGAYLYLPQESGATALYQMPLYPDPKPPYDRTGAGDAFASTFVAALALGKTPLEALTWAPINSMSVVQKIGAQEGLLTRPELEQWLIKAPADYKVRPM
ncbi:MAG: carbohydrate kinase family protein [Patescibacteria group bacterium]|nr:carbohydrate kinase family protein [Patescibacteria group bacterium]